MERTEEQLRAIAEWTPAMVADFRRLRALPDDAVGLDGIQAHSCWTNGMDAAAELGITEANGFTWDEVRAASDYHAVVTAKLFELI